MYDPPLIYKGLEPGMMVKVPDGRIGRLYNFRIIERGFDMPGRAAVQFYDSDSKTFYLEGYSLADLCLPTP